MLQLVAGVAHIAAHRRIGPARLAIAMKAQVLFDELAHRVHHGLGIVQCTQPLARQLGAHDVVVVEGDLVAVQPPGGRLADVVQQRRQADHQVGLVVGVGLAVLVVAGLLQRDRLIEHRQ